jgi:hypothetical protein
MCCKPCQGKALHPMRFVTIDGFEGMAESERAAGLYLDKVKDSIAAEGD